MIKRNTLILDFEENKNFDKIILNTIDTYIKFFDENKPINPSLSRGIDHSNLVFLIGFPRSGTTLPR